MENVTSPRRDIIVIGASAGGVEALKIFLRNLPLKLNITIFMVLHVPEHSKSHLSEILQRETSWVISRANDGEEISKGKIYVARSGAHLLVEDGHIVLGKGPRENRFRPSIDALFRSAAYNYRERVVGILLSGSMDDGCSGLWTIKRLGGLTMVQEESEAVFPQMIINAKQYVAIDHEVAVADMGTTLEQIIHDPSIPEITNLTEEEISLLELEIIVAEQDNSFELGILEKGIFTTVTCPECHGALVQLMEGKIIRFRCHTGHAFSISSLMAGISVSINDQLWQSMKSFEENAMLLEKLSVHFQESGQEEFTQSYAARAKDYRNKAREVHGIISSHEEISADPQELREEGD